MKKITKELLLNFNKYLLEEEKSTATVEKYMRDVRAFFAWVNENAEDVLIKNTILKYKEYLLDVYAPASVNSIISTLNRFFEFNNWYELRVKLIKIQKNTFLNKEKELTKKEYERLLMSAKRKKNKRLYYLMQTICSTGIRVSELRFITVESLKYGVTEIKCKGKMRQVFLPKQLCKMLKEYVKQIGINSGSIFVSKSGRPLDRSNIWSDMKKLCTDAFVSPSKVFPHNLRHLFARTYYTIQKDIVRLADILGHSSVNTTRIYTMETGEIHRMQIQRLGLLRC